MKWIGWSLCCLDFDVITLTIFIWNRGRSFTADTLKCVWDSINIQREEVILLITLVTPAHRRNIENFIMKNRCFLRINTLCGLVETQPARKWIFWCNTGVSSVHTSGFCMEHPCSIRRERVIHLIIIIIFTSIYRIIFLRIYYKYIQPYQPSIYPNHTQKSS